MNAIHDSIKVSMMQYILGYEEKHTNHRPIEEMQTEEPEENEYAEYAHAVDDPELFKEEAIKKATPAKKPSKKKTK